MANKKKTNNNKSKSNQKDIKKTKKVEEEVEKVNYQEKIIIVLGILIFIILFYLLTLYVTNKHADDDKDKSKEEETTDTVSISYDSILAGTSLSQGKDEYLVLYYDKGNEDIANKYNEILNNYKAKEDHLTIYMVDMSNPLNNKSKGSEANTSPASESDLSITGPTLIKVNNGEVVDYLEGEEDISGYLE